MPREEMTLHEALAEFGITSETGPNGSRFLRDGASTLGSATANQAWNLVHVLKRYQHKPTMGRVEEW